VIRESPLHKGQGETSPTKLFIQLNFDKILSTSILYFKASYVMYIAMETPA
jgi:hypothetical protein